MKRVRVASMSVLISALAVAVALSAARELAAARDGTWVVATVSSIGEGDKHHHYRFRVDAVLSDPQGEHRPGAVLDVWVLGTEGPDGGQWLLQLRSYRDQDHGWFERPERLHGPAGWPDAGTLVPMLGARRSRGPLDYGSLTQLTDTTLIDGVLGAGPKVAYTIAPVRS